MPDQSQRQTIEQQRAQAAWEAIEAVREASFNLKPKEQFHNDYGTQVRRLPAMIQVNGLASTMAFLKAKGGTGKDEKKEFTALYQQMSDRIAVYLLVSDDLMTLIREGSSDQYRRAAAEAIAFGNWLKRYVEAEGWKSSSQD